MNRKELIKLLEKNGWEISSGAKHDMARHPRTKIKIPIPRHNEISKGTAETILKEAGLK